MSEYDGSMISAGSSKGERTPPPEGYIIAIWLAVVSITILFLALTSAYIFNRAASQTIILPKVLWVSTGILILSSLSMEWARSSLRRRVDSAFKLRIFITFILGVGFLLTQLIAMKGLFDAGFFINKNFRSAYTYIFTGLHGVHLIAGLIAILYLLLRPHPHWTNVRRRVAVDVTALYWHFLDVLWLCLFVLLFVWKGKI